MKIYAAIGLAIILTIPVTTMAGSMTSDTITIDNGIFNNNLTVENGISSGSLNISGISTESQKGDSQVCYNASGDLLPCSSTLSTDDGVITNTLTVGSSISSDSISVTNSISGSTIAISSLPSGEQRGSNPLCYNDSGEILPCTSDFIVPDVSTLIGSWTGNKVYNHNFGTGCHDEEVTVQLVPYSSSGPNLDSITTRDVVLGLDIDVVSRQVISGYITSFYYPFDELTTFTLTFDSYGNATGEWFEHNTDCLGTWSLTKDY